MKRTAMIAIVIAALTFGVVGFAVATSDSKDVTITARVNPAMELTVAESAVDFGEVTPGAVATADVNSQVRVRSNMAYTLTTTDDGSDLAPFLSDNLPAAEQARGVTSFDVTYTLDLTPDAAYDDLDPETDYTTVITHTAAQ